MELNEIVDPWIKQLENAAKPYLEFVQQVSKAVSDLEPQIEKAYAALSEYETKPVLSAPTVTGIEPQHLHALQRELTEQREEQDLVRASFQKKISELNHQIETLESEGNEAPASDSEFAIPAFAGIDPDEFDSLKTKLSEAEAREQAQAVKISDLHAQIAFLKTALAEAKAEAEAAHAEMEREFESPSSHGPEDTSNSEAPPRKAAVRREPRVASLKTDAFPSRTVLLVDDAEINRVLMSHYFKGLPVQLEFAVSVDAALTKCKQHRFDLIVVDDELHDLENPEFRQISAQLVGLSNRSGGHSPQASFQHVLNRGQSRDAFIAQLKGFLWDAERTA